MIQMRNSINFSLISEIGKVALPPDPEPGEIPREDVTAVLAEVLETPETAGQTFDLVSGDTPLEEAVKKAAYKKSNS